LQVLGFGTVFKKIGVNAAKATKHYVRTFRDKNALDIAKQTSNLFNSEASNAYPPGFSSSNSEIVRDGDEEVRGLTTRKTYEYIA
jgi:protoheme ferro-lyase